MKQVKKPELYRARMALKVARKRLKKMVANGASPNRIARAEATVERNLARYKAAKKLAVDLLE